VKNPNSQAALERPGGQVQETMRDFKGMKRQRGRNRGGGGGGGKPQHNANRSFDSNGPEGIKVRGAAQGVFEKYQQLARDAASAGDRVLAENYLQHAEHYFRTVRAMQPQRPPSEIIGREGLSGFDIDFEAEPEEATVETNEQTDQSSEGDGDRDRGYDNNGAGNGRRDGGYQDRPRFENRDRQDRGADQPRNDQPRNDQSRNDQPRAEGQGQGQGRRDRWRERDDRPRDDRPRDDRPRDDRPRDDQPRSEQPRSEQPRETQGGDRPYRERRERFERDDRAPVAVAEAPAPVRPESRQDDEVPSRRLRGQDGTVSEAPAFLSRGPAASAPAPAPVSDDGEAPKPRRGRPRKIVASEGED
jgi:hypothetical protein